MAFCLFSQNKLSGERESEKVLLSVREPGVTMGRGVLHLSMFSGPPGKGERIAEVVFNYIFYGPKTSFSLLAVSACGRCPGQSMTSCPWGCSTMVSDTSNTPGAEGLKK